MFCIPAEKLAELVEMDKFLIKRKRTDVDDEPVTDNKSVMDGNA
jgi:hypothetical protein